MNGPGLFSLFATKAAPEFKWEDDRFKVPDIRDAIVYELMVDEFNGTFDGVIERLDYIASLGVNVIELMPLTNSISTFQWGYDPLNYFAPEERYGGPEGLKRLVNACHLRGIAVIHDAVYGHTHNEFSYARVYNKDLEDLGIKNPMLGNFEGHNDKWKDIIAKEPKFGIGIDFNKEFARDFVLKVNYYWIDEFHIDGFRYDQVALYYDGSAPGNKSYAELVYNTYTYTITIPRFAAIYNNREYSSIIQTAEHLSYPEEMLKQTYSNSCWYDKTRDVAENLATAIKNKQDFGGRGKEFIENIILKFKDYPTEYKNTTNGDCFPVSPFQYIESHDHSNLLYILVNGRKYLNCYEKDEKDPDKNGNRVADILENEGFNVAQWNSGFDIDKCYKLQPFAIAFMTSVGTPMIRQGQEFGETYGVSNLGMVKILGKKDLHWEYFYQKQGSALVKLYRRLGKLRTQLPALRSRNNYYYDSEDWKNQGVFVYRRGEDKDTAIVFINFGDSTQYINFSFPSVGIWKECIDEKKEDKIEYTGSPVKITVNSNYGAIYLKEA